MCESWDFLPQDKLGLWNFEILADLLGEEFVDFSMARDGGSFAGRSVDVDAVITAFTRELDTVAFELTDQIDPRASSSASARFDSKTN